MPAGVQVEITHELNGPLADIDSAHMRDMVDRRTNVALIEVAGSSTDTIDFARFLADSIPGIHVVATGPKLAPETLIEAMRAGVSEYLPKPLDPPELAAALGRIAKRFVRAGAEATASGTGERGKVIAFLPVKGGTGTTTAAVNLAVELQRRTGDNTLLVDLDLEMGGVAILLGIRPRFSFLDLARNFHRLDQGLVSSYVERYNPGLHVLAAPMRPERSDVITGDEAARIIEFLRGVYKYVIVDMSKSLSQMTLSALAASDTIVAVTTADLPTLGSLKRILPVLERMDSETPKRLRVVINRYHPDGAVTIDDIRTLLDMDVHWTLSNDYKAAIRAANEGKPIALNGRSPYARDIETMVAEMADIPMDGTNENGTGGGLGGLKRLFGWKARK